MADSASRAFGKGGVRARWLWNRFRLFRTCVSRDWKQAVELIWIGADLQLAARCSCRSDDSFNMFFQQMLLQTVFRTRVDGWNCFGMERELLYQTIDVWQSTVYSWSFAASRLALTLIGWKHSGVWPDAYSEWDSTDCKREEAQFIARHGEDRQIRVLRSLWNWDETSARA